MAVNLRSADANSERGPTSDSRFETTARGVALIAGGGILLAGVVAAFRSVDGISTAALLAAGFGLVCVAYVGRYITRIRFKEFELLIERITQKAEQALSSLDSIALSSTEDVQALSPGGRRDMERDAKVATVMKEVRTMENLTKEEVRKIASVIGQDARIRLLGVMKARPDLWDAEVLMSAIERPHGNYDQDRFLVVASDMLHTLAPLQRDHLRQIVEHLRETGAIRPMSIRWDTSRRLLRLISRVERDNAQSSAS